MCTIATEDNSSGVTQPTASMPWLIAGDLNITKGTMMQWCQPYVQPNVDCISDSGWPDDMDAQKADFALSQGIVLEHVKSWVGWHSQPCASDAHDAVVVMGSLDLKQLHRQDKPSGWKKPGIALFEKSSSSQVTGNRISASASDDVHLAAQPPTRPKRPHPETITAVDEEVTEPQAKTVPKRLAEPQATTAASPTPPATAATTTATTTTATATTTTQ